MEPHQRTAIQVDMKALDIDPTGLSDAELEAWATSTPQPGPEAEAWTISPFRKQEIAMPVHQTGEPERDIAQDFADQVLRIQANLNHEFVTAKIREGYHARDFEWVPAGESLCQNSVKVSGPATTVTIKPSIRLKAEAVKEDLS